MNHDIKKKGLNNSGLDARIPLQHILAWGQHLRLPGKKQLEKLLSKKAPALFYLAPKTDLSKIFQDLIGFFWDVKELPADKADVIPHSKESWLKICSNLTPCRSDDLF